VPRRSPIVPVFLGVAIGAVAGWFAHRAIVIPRSELSVTAAYPVNSAPGPLVQPATAESRTLAPASGGEAHPSVTGATAPFANGTSRGKASTRNESEQPSAAALSQKPALDDLRDSVSIQCAFGPGTGGSWPNGKLTVGDAACAGGPIDFQLINYDAGTAQMAGLVTRSPKGEVPATVSTSDSDVTFTGRAANGTLIVISKFGKFDNAGHHTAVLSMHDGKHELDIAQFYGSCDSALKSLNSATQ